METVDVCHLVRSFVIRVGCEGNRINAYTLASTLVGEAALLERLFSAFSGYAMDALLHSSSASRRSSWAVSTRASSGRPSRIR